MSRSPSEPEPGRNLSLGAKITVAFFLFSSLVSVGLVLVNYGILSRSLSTELKSRVRNLAALGAVAVDRGALQTLVDALDGRPGRTHFGPSRRARRTAESRTP